MESGLEPSPNLQITGTEASAKSLPWKWILEVQKGHSKSIRFSRKTILLYIYIYIYIYSSPKNPWTLLWKRLTLFSAGFWDLQTSSFEIPWFLGREFESSTVGDYHSNSLWLPGWMVWHFLFGRPSGKVSGEGTKDFSSAMQNFLDYQNGTNTRPMWPQLCWRT